MEKFAENVWQYYMYAEESDNYAEKMPDYAEISKINENCSLGFFQCIKYTLTS